MQQENNNLAIKTETIKSNNKLLLMRSFKKILLTTPLLLCTFLIAACGIIKHNVLTNIEASKMIRFNVISAIENSLVNNNADKATSSLYEDAMSKRTDKSTLLSHSFCSDYLTTNNDILKSITTPNPINVGGHEKKYSYFWTGVESLIIDPSARIGSGVTSPTPEEVLYGDSHWEWGSDFIYPATSSVSIKDWIGKAENTFHTDKAWSTNDDSVYRGILAVKSGNPNVTSIKVGTTVYIRFFLIMDQKHPENKGSIDIFVIPAESWDYAK